MSRIICAVATDGGRRVAIASLLLLLTACTTVMPGADLKLLEFLRDGSTTREEVLLKLGEPSATLEAEKILTYRIGGDGDLGYFVETRKGDSWQNVQYSLVLVFDSNAVLQKHNLVYVR